MMKHENPPPPLPPPSTPLPPPTLRLTLASLARADIAPLAGVGGRPSSFRRAAAVASTDWGEKPGEGYAIGRDSNVGPRPSQNELDLRLGRMNSGLGAGWSDSDEDV
jgi:hypothetical protein